MSHPIAFRRSLSQGYTVPTGHRAEFAAFLTTHQFDGGVDSVSTVIINGTAVARLGVITTSQGDEVVVVEAKPLTANSGEIITRAGNAGVSIAGLLYPIE